MKFFGVVGCGPRTKQLDFGGNLDLDPRFLNLDQNPDPEIFLLLYMAVSLSVEDISSSKFSDDIVAQKQGSFVTGVLSTVLTAKSLIFYA